LRRPGGRGRSASPAAPAGAGRSRGRAPAPWGEPESSRHGAAATSARRSCAGLARAAPTQEPQRTAPRRERGPGGRDARRPQGSVRIGGVGTRFDGKGALVLGVANKRSIAWAIAQRLAAGGARLAFTYQGERIEQSVRDLAATVDTALVTECDVRSDQDVEGVFAEVADVFGGELDLLVHSVAFAAAEDLEGRFTETPRDRLWLAVDRSAYSLVACA